MDAIFARSFAGRFFRMSSPLKRSTSLHGLVQEHGWVESMGSGQPFARAFCVGEPPFNGSLDESTMDLAYDDGGTGVWRLWLREEERTAGRRQTEALAVQMALQDNPDSPLKKRHRSEQKQLLERAKIDILKTASPKMRIIPVISSSDWVWIGSRSSATDLELSAFLSHVLGRIQSDPLIWTPGNGLGWSVYSMTSLLAFLEVEAGQIASDVSLTEIDVQGRSMTCKATDSASVVRDVMREFAKSSSDAVVRRLSFEVYKEGNCITLDVDQHGVFRALAPSSVGGLPHERILRRFNDVFFAAQRINSVLNELHSKFEEN